MRQPLVAGNWKMNGTQASAEALVQAVQSGVAATKSVEVAVCPPAILLPAVSGALKNSSAIVWGGQDVSTHAEGAYTGEISVDMLRDFACRYVIVGHSERREYHSESNELVAEKALVAWQRGLIPIICVGETLAEREANETENVIGAQLRAILNLLPVEALKDIVIAYEPVWAIGTGLTASPDQAQAVHAFIRSRLNETDSKAASEIRILYGGSVKPGNAEGLFSQPDIDGGLIGGASLSAEDFTEICLTADLRRVTNDGT